MTLYELPMLLSMRRFRQLADPPIGKRQMSDYVRTGQIRSIRLGARIYIPRNEVARLTGENGNGGADAKEVQRPSD